MVGRGEEAELQDTKAPVRWKKGGGVHARLAGPSQAGARQGRERRTACRGEGGAGRRVGVMPMKLGG